MSIAIAGYTLLEVICQDTNTVTYRACKQLDQTSVIIKTLKAEQPSITELTYLKHEYKNLQELNINGLIKPIALENYQNGLALICTDFQGKSLEKIISQRSFELKEFLAIAIQIVTTVAELHQHNIIHKNLQPCNILINRDQILIIDLSFASRLSSQNQSTNQPHLLEGNLAYISPEQTGRMNRTIDYRTDFYSLGVIFYEMLTGKHPFPVTHSLKLVHCHIAKTALSPSQINREIPQIFSDIVMKMLAKTAEDRYQSALGLKADLETCLKMLQTNKVVTHFTAGNLDSCSQFLIPQKLYGREQEVATLIDAFQRVSQGSSEIVLVSGYSGIGKSSLVNEVHKLIVAAQGYFISGKFDQFKRNIPYASLIQAFQELIRQLLTESSQVIATWQTKLLAALGANGQIIIDVIPDIERIIGVQPVVSELGATESQNRFNRVFQQFIHVFSQPEHPLVIFLDDLQWADLASLKLIQSIASNPDSQYLLLIGAYRDNEVNATHPLILTLEEMQRSITVNNIVVQPLQINHTTQLISDTLRHHNSKIVTLVELLFQKTQGNPFFLIQLLKSLYKENLLSFNFQEGCWQWDIHFLQNVDITDNVVELMVTQIQQLSPQTQHILKLAACIGDKFNLDVLALVNEQSLSKTATDLWEALQAGLILPLSEAYKIPLVLDIDTSELQLNFLKINYKFLHDRVQQAAYSLIPDSQKKETHLKIGKLLLRNTNLKKREEDIFTLVNQLNYGIELLTTESEKYELVQLNLIAGQKAKIATAYDSAMRYFNVGLELLTVNSWLHYYKLTLALHELAAETAYLNGDFEQMEKWVTVVLQQANTHIDKMKVYEVQMQACMAQVKQIEAVKIGLQALNLLGINLPEEPSAFDIQQTLSRTATNLTGKNIAELIDLPVITKTDKLVAIRMLTSMGSPTYQAAPTLFPLIVCEQVNLSLEYGNAPFSAYAYACYGVILNGVVQDTESAYQFGKLALNLVEKFNAVELKASVFFVTGACTIHGKVHARKTLSLLLDGYQSGLENGHFEYGGYAAMQKCQYSYLIGDELTKLEREIATISKTLAQLKQENVLSWLQTFQQAILTLLYSSEPCYLVNEGDNKKQLLPILEKANDRTGLHYYYLNKLILCYLFREYHQALENALQAEQYLDGVKAFLVVPVFYFYDSLAQIAIYSSTSSQQEALLQRVENNQEKMQKWASHAPMNFQHKYELVAAEKARVLSQPWQAMECYDRAIAHAKEHGYLQEEALANELAAEFYFSQAKTKIAQVYLVEAYYAYLRWGATAKVKDLAARYPHILTQTKQDTTKQESQNLDLATAIKASQTLSGEIVLNNLLTKLIQIVLENAGAQTGFLLLNQAGKLVVEAAGGIDDHIVGETVPGDRFIFPLSVINYVTRTQESIVLNNATTEEIFANDPYVIQREPKSVLCTPILHQGRLTGILYLENNLITGAFTRDRLEVLQLLSAQAAISIENARLYKDLENYNRTLETKVAERTLELQLKNSQLQQEIRDRQTAEAAAQAANRAKSQFLANMSHELRTPLNGILGYAQILKKDKTLTQQQNNGLDIIHRCGEHLLTLINDILDLSKIEAQKIELYATDFHFPSFLAEIVAICQIRAAQNQISLRSELPATLPEFVQADEKRLRQVLLNLIGNAIKFTHNGSVTFRVSDRDRQLVFQVADTGVGIAAEQLSEIFLPFQQVGEYRHHTEGTGLGLAISRQLVRMMGGDITVQSTLNQGSIFSFALDLPRCHSTQVTSPDKQRIIGFTNNKQKILVVDDKSSNRSVLVNMLEPLGFEVAEATDGLDCLAKVQTFKPDCIFIDLVMPTMDGFTATRRLRTLPDLTGVIIIAISASVFDFDKQQSHAVGCDDFLAKPIREAELLEKLRIHLNLQWVYEQQTATQDLEHSHKQSLPEDIIPPPAEEIAVLLDLAMMGDLRSILAQTAKIETLDRRYIPFALHLRQLAKGYKERQILDFVKKYAGD